MVESGYGRVVPVTNYIASMTIRIYLLTEQSNWDQVGVEEMVLLYSFSMTPAALAHGRILPIALGVLSTHPEGKEGA